MTQGSAPPSALLQLIPVDPQKRAQADIRSTRLQFDRVALDPDLTVWECGSAC